MLRVKDSRQLQAAVLSLKRGPKEVRSIVGKETRATFGKPWKQEVNRQSRRGYGGDQRHPLLQTGVTIGGNNPPVGRAFTSKKRLSGGLGNDRFYVLEYGTRLPQHPPPNPKGYTMPGALHIMVPRVVAFWVQSIVRNYVKALGG